MISPGDTALASPAHEIVIWLSSPSSPSEPQVKGMWSAGLSSTVPARRRPSRSLGPGRSCRMATGRPARPAASRTRATFSACSSSEPCEKFNRATSMPASTMRASTSGLRDAGPMVATIFVRRMGAGRYSGSRLCLLWPTTRAAEAVAEAELGPSAEAEALGAPRRGGDQPVALRARDLVVGDRLVDDRLGDARRLAGQRRLDLEEHGGGLRIAEQRLRGRAREALVGDDRGDVVGLVA